MASESNLRFYLLIALAYLAISLILFWPVTLHPTDTVAGGVPNSVFSGSGDVFQNLWTLWWVNYAIFALHASPYATNLLYAPIGANLVTETLSPIAAIFSLPFQALGLAFSYNVLFFLDFALSGLFMFLLADHIVKNRYAAFIAGIVFAFSPFHLMHAGVGHLNWDSIQFLPLFVLLLLKMIEEERARHAIYAGIALALLLFWGDPEQGIITLMFVALFLLVYVSRSREALMRIINFAFLKNSLIIVAVAALVSSPFLVPIANGIAHGALAAANQNNSLKSYMISSNPLLSFFLPSPYNNFFSWASASYDSIYSVNPTERVAYIGYAALALVAIGVWKDRKNGFAGILPWLIVTLFFAYLSMGPYVQVGSYSSPGQDSVPGIYPAFTQMPIINLVREPARFELIVTLGLAVIAAMGFRGLIEVYKGRIKIKRLERYAAIAIVALMLVEYNGIPVSGGFISSYFFNIAISPGYQMLHQASNFTVMILPTIQNIGENPTVFHPQLYTGMSMYLQTAFAKPIIGGYTSRVNYTQQLQSLEIPLSIYGSFLQRGLNFVYTSPVSENYTNVTLYWLSKYDVGYIPIIRQAYSPQNLTVLEGKMQSIFGDPYYSDNLTTIFSTRDALSKSTNRSVIGYPSLGTWAPGCGSGAFCDNSSNTYWWGGNVRGISVFAPRNRTNLTMSFGAIAYYRSPSIPLSVTVLSQSPATYRFNLSLNSNEFAVPLSLSPGTTQILFYSPPGVGNSSASGLIFGIKNITFSQR
ncbi:MAG: hypothetical protein KGH54_03030 [Candidatus Micrarchaeota archaeon]|nr:hypothetical protein [Candidatus Micrarchaeota archaeon]